MKNRLYFLISFFVLILMFLHVFFKITDILLLLDAFDYSEEVLEEVEGWYREWIIATHDPYNTDPWMDVILYTEMIPWEFQKVMFYYTSMGDFEARTAILKYVETRDWEELYGLYCEECMEKRTEDYFLHNMSQHTNNLHINPNRAILLSYYDPVNLWIYEADYMQEEYYTPVKNIRDASLLEQVYYYLSKLKYFGLGFFIYCVIAWTWTIY